MLEHYCLLLIAPRECEVNKKDNTAHEMNEHDHCSPVKEGRRAVDRGRSVPAINRAVAQRWSGRMEKGTGH